MPSNDAKTKTMLTIVKNLLSLMFIINPRGTSELDAACLSTALDIRVAFLRAYQLVRCGVASASLLWPTTTSLSLDHNIVTAGIIGQIAFVDTQEQNSIALRNELATGSK